MVLATSDPTDTVRKELKTLPGGYVVLRRLTYGEKIQRRVMVSGMKVRAGDKKSKDFEGEMNMVNEKATIFDFERCITEHNLEKKRTGLQVADEDGNVSDTVPLNFSNINDVRALDPRVGEEIDDLLSELNNFEEDDDEGEG